MSFASKVIDYHFSLSHDWSLPDGISLIYPFDDAEVKDAFSAFYLKYFNDDKNRFFIFGINPGRFGAGVTGIPFTDPKVLEDQCSIQNPFDKKNELSSIFVYDLISHFQNPQNFYKTFYITSVCPFGFLKASKNYNYYDEKELQNALEDKIIANILSQMQFGARKEIAFSMGKGQNYRYLKSLNDKYGFFDKIKPLPHPRWVMQYKLKEKEKHIDTYLFELQKALRLESQSDE
jgi:hypothetical protein